MDEFNHVIDTFIKGVNHLIHFFLPSMLASKKSIVVNFSSSWGRKVDPAMISPCACSKWGIDGLSLALSQKFPEPLAFTTLNPGVIHTPLLVHYYGDRAKEYRTTQQWIQKAGPMLLGLNRENCNGKQLEVPSFGIE